MLIITPTCWTVAEQYFHGSEIYTNGEDTLPQVYRPIHPENYVTSGNYSLRMKYRVLLAMPELDESVDMSRLRLNMNVSQTQTFYKLQVGVMDDPMDESTFVAVAVVNNPVKDVMMPLEQAVISPSRTWADRRLTRTAATSWMTWC